MTTEYVAAGTLPKPGPIGRTLRVLVGLTLFSLVAWLITDYQLGKTATQSLAIWFGVGYAFFSLPYTATVPYGHGMNWRWRVALGGMLVSVAAGDLIWNQNPLGAMFAGALAISGCYAATVGGCSYFSAGILGVPG